MKQILSGIRRADAAFGLIEPGDHILVGVSGGKDSLVLLCALARYRRFAPHPFTLSAATLELGLTPMALDPVRSLCQKLDVPYRVEQTQIGPIVFEQRQEKHPCALCAKLRRGALNRLAVAMGANKVALGHHRDDVIETFLLSLLYEGRLHTFSAKTVLPQAGVTVIRPMVYLSQAQIVHAARTLDLPVQKNPCPVDHQTRREDMKRLSTQLCAYMPKAKQQILAALCAGGLLSAVREEPEPPEERP